MRAAVWSAAAALVVLASRALAYALAPRTTILSLTLERSAGGPRLVLVALTSLAVAIAVAAAIVGLAVLAVRERLALERRAVLSPPRPRPARFARRYAALLVACAVAFDLLESYLHWRAGLGWHGLHCLVGPVHRNAIPILAALSLVAVAAAEAVELALAWTRRTLLRLLPQLPSPVVGPSPVATASSCLSTTWIGPPLPARGPPGRVLVLIET